MNHNYDVFNGDADGICALHQLRLSDPEPTAELITGVKRDINLLTRIENVTNSRITVLDISMDTNREALVGVLENGNEVRYIDHHYAGEIPDSPLLTAHIDVSPERCTSLIVDQLLWGKYRLWAICGAYGDNLHAVAASMAEQEHLDQQQSAQLCEIGELLNYNGYGARLRDLYFAPDQLYLDVQTFENPFDYYHGSDCLKTLQLGFKSDMDLALSQPEFATRGRNRVFRFPDNPWARRVSGVFANLKARENPDGAHALITENNDDTLRISVRAPVNNRRDADTLCRSFPTGGGRAGAAGINALPAEKLTHFLNEFEKTYS
ncbi:MAG: acetyltransferase [Desulfobulbaceae bacterium]|nr:MAG: acetyltransferase [Desulfobulbaceae bacterium]